MTKVHQITPFIHVPDLQAALAFFCETLPFVLKYRESNYAYIELEGCGLCQTATGSHLVLRRPDRALQTA